MHGLYLLWWVQERHIPVVTVAAILAAGDLAVTALEVPTGWFADRLGHRTSLITGSLLQIAGMFFAWLGRGIPGVLTSCLLIAAGDAFRSGADQALLYRSCAALGREADFQSIEGRTRGAQLAALVALVLAGGVIVQTLGFAAGWQIEIAMCMLGLLIAWAMVEPAAPIDEVRNDPSVPSGTSTRPAQEVPRAGLVKSMLGLIAPGSVVGSLATAAIFAAQTIGYREPARVTMVVAIVTLAEASGSIVGARIAGGGRILWTFAVTGIVVTVGAVVIPHAFLFAIVALCFLMGLAYPLRAAAIQRVAADDVRARAASFASACDKALATVALICAGLLIT